MSATTWTTLGTMGGPIASPVRAQPANLLTQNGLDAALIDTGDGVTDQLMKAGLDLSAVGTIVLSHLHIDHTAGLYGILGRRLQQRIPCELRIYGPRGTRTLVDQITASNGYLDDLVKTAPAAGGMAPTLVTVTEVTEGSVFMIGSATVTATTNSHFGFDERTPEAARFQSLSYRFDLLDRSIVFTGDTGPSANVERLARGADVLVTEIIDPDQALADVQALRPDMPAFVLAAIRSHFEQEHLTPDEVGRLAHRADVGAVVLTHNPIDDHGIQRAGNVIAAHYPGSIVFAGDLDTY